MIHRWIRLFCHFLVFEDHYLVQDADVILSVSGCDKESLSIRFSCTELFQSGAFKETSRVAIGYKGDTAIRSYFAETLDRKKHLLIYNSEFVISTQIDMCFLRGLNSADRVEFQNV